MSNEPVYEMFWDCSYCGQTKNLGLTHRHCPSCGAPQQPEKRYFPPEDQKVAVQDHPFVGADRTCPACRAPSSAAAKNCGQCGSPLDGAQAVATVADAAPIASGAAPAAPAAAMAAAAPQEKKSSRKMWIFGVLGALVVSCCVVGGGLALFWKEDKAVTVTRHEWRRAIAIERYQTENDSAWCDSLPSGARVTRRARRERGTRQVQDGETCTSRNVDNGDGTYRQVQDCRPRYRSEPTYDDHCDYTIDRWARVNEVVAQGQGTAPPPSWPAPQVTGCAQLGCTRAGQRSETYTLHLTIDGEGAESCTVGQQRWTQVQDGSRWNASVGVLTSSVDCDEMQPL